MHQILLVEDQREFQVAVSRIFEDGEHTVTVASDTLQATQFLNKQKFDLILLDIQLPGQGGLDFCATLQENENLKDIPVIFLTGSENLDSKLAAFSLGAEDYITKPFNPHELRARVSAKLRKARKQNQTGEEVRIGAFLFKLASQRLSNAADGKDFDVTPRELRLLYYLAKNPDRIMTRQQILEEVWGQGTNVTDRSVDTHIYLLRKKISPFSDCIEAVTGVGYRFTLDAHKKSNAA